MIKSRQLTTILSIYHQLIRGRILKFYVRPNCQTVKLMKPGARQLRLVPLDCIIKMFYLSFSDLFHKNLMVEVHSNPISIFHCLLFGYRAQLCALLRRNITFENRGYSGCKKVSLNGCWGLNFRCSREPNLLTESEPSRQLVFAVSSVQS